MEDDKKDYIITITGGGKNREIRLSAGMFNFGVMSAIIGVFLFIGACGYSVFSALHYRQNVAAVTESRKAAAIQQEQLLNVSKKASALSETLQNLAQQEEELRIQAGVNKPAREDKIDDEDLNFDFDGEWKPPTSETTPDENPLPQSEIPATVENPAPPIQSQWTPPQSETPATVENPAPPIQSQWTPPQSEIPATVENPAPPIQSQWSPPQSEIPATVENPAPPIQSQWTPPQSEIPATVENPAPQVQSQWSPPQSEVPATVENPATPVQSQWTPPQSETPVTVENPAPPVQSQWTPPQPETPATVENPAPPVQSQWKPPANRGQGGPTETLKVDDVSEALAMLEQRVNIRADSLNDFQNELKIQREQMSFFAAVPSNAPEMLVIDEGFVFNPSVTFDLSSFGGTPSVNPNMPSIWPTNGIVSSPYGLRWGGTDFHPGIDIANDMGTPIVATADGVVEYAGWNSGGYGNMVDINHGNGLMTRYGHASQVVVTAGQYVKRGQLIAYMGSTGFSTGPHVHYEVHVNGQRVNPISYL